MIVLWLLVQQIAISAWHGGPMESAIAAGRRNPIARRRNLRRELAVRGAVSVAELTKILGASSATIRRDLDVLQREGVLERGHGGAAARAVRPAEEALAVRELKNVAEKRVIAAAARDLVKPGDTVFLNDGSTVMALARDLATIDMELFIVTPAVNVANVLVQNPRYTVCLLGGFVRGSSLATGGPFAFAMLDEFNADIALLSCDAFNLEAGLCFANTDDAMLSRRMAARAKRSVAMVISPKFSWTARLSGVGVDDLDVMVTDTLPPSLRSGLHSAGVEVIEARATERG